MATCNGWGGVFSGDHFLSCTHLQIERECLGNQCDHSAFANIRAAGRDTVAPAHIDYDPSLDGQCGVPPFEFKHVGACCFETVEVEPHGGQWQTGREPGMIPKVLCRPVSEQECNDGFIRRRVQRSLSPEPGSVWCVYKHSLHEMFGQIRVWSGPNVLEPSGTWEPLAPDRLRPTIYHGDHTACSCQFSSSPFFDQRYLDAGFRDCVRSPGVAEPWEDVCDIPLSGDGFQCRTIGFPLAIDADGFAVFDAGLRRTDPGANACVYTLGDLYVDSGGVAHSVSCVTTTTGEARTEVAIGDLHHSECVAMYQDYRWDDAFEC